MRSGRGDDAVAIADRREGDAGVGGGEPDVGAVDLAEEPLEGRGGQPLDGRRQEERGRRRGEDDHDQQTLEAVAAQIGERLAEEGAGHA